MNLHLHNEQLIHNSERRHVKEHGRGRPFYSNMFIRIEIKTNPINDFSYLMKSGRWERWWLFSFAESRQEEWAGMTLQTSKVVVIVGL